MCLFVDVSPSGVSLFATPRGGGNARSLLGCMYSPFTRALEVVLRERPRLVEANDANLPADGHALGSRSQQGRGDKETT